MENNRYAASLLVLVFLSTSAAAAQSANLCDAIVSQARAQIDLTSGRKGLYETLTQGPSPILEFASYSDVAAPRDAAEADAYKELLGGRFHPSVELTRAFNASVSEGSNFEIASLTGSSIHALVESGGSANCETLLFFDARAGKEAVQLPDLPVPAALSGYPPRDQNVFCFVDRGGLARAMGTTIFAEFSSDLFAFTDTLNAEPLDNGRWGTSCGVAAQFQSLYSTDKIFLAPYAGLAQGDLAAIAPRIAEALDQTPDTKRFSFGPAVPDAMKPALAQMLAAAQRIVAYQPLPLFGTRDSEVAEYEMPDYAKAFALVIGGRVYLARIAHKVIGWRDFHDYYLVLYDWRGDQLTPVASAVIGVNQGPLTSLKLTRD